MVADLMSFDSFGRPCTGMHTWAVGSVIVLTGDLFVKDATV